MTHWNEAAESRSQKVELLEGLVPGYNYSHEDMAHRTDERLCKLLVYNIGEAKKSMFHILQTAFELHRELLLRDFERLRDELDIFSDEIKARAFEWDKNKPQEWMERLIDHDYRIVTGLGRLKADIKALEKAFLASGEAPRELKRLDSLIKPIDREIEELVMMFKEREAICNIKDTSLDKTFEAIRSRLRKGF